MFLFPSLWILLVKGKGKDWGKDVRDQEQVLREQPCDAFKVWLTLASPSEAHGCSRRRRRHTCSPPELFVGKKKENGLRGLQKNTHARRAIGAGINVLSLHVFFWCPHSLLRPTALEGLVFLSSFFFLFKPVVFSSRTLLSSSSWKGREEKTFKL